MPLKVDKIYLLLIISAKLQVGLSRTLFTFGNSLKLSLHLSLSGVCSLSTVLHNCPSLALGSCPVGPVLPYGERVPFKPWLATLLVMVS